MGASVVYDPTNATNLLNLKQTMDDLKKMREDLLSNTQFINNVLSNSNELKRLMRTLDNMACTTNKFNIYMGMVGDLKFCNQKLNVDMTLTKLDGVSGKVKSILAGAYAMSQYESIKSLKDLNNELEAGIREMNSINSSLRLDINRILRKNYVKKNGGKDMTFNTKVEL